MQISSTSPAPHVRAASGAPAAPPPPADRMPFGSLEIGQIGSNIVKELDTDGDGQVSEQEFAFYRAGKAARGEYIPAEAANAQIPAGMTGRSMAEELFYSAFEIGAKRH